MTNPPEQKSDLKQSLANSSLLPITEFADTAGSHSLGDQRHRMSGAREGQYPLLRNFSSDRQRWAQSLPLRSRIRNSCGAIYPQNSRCLNSATKQYLLNIKLCLLRLGQNYFASIVSSAIPGICDSDNAVLPALSSLAMRSRTVGTQSGQHAAGRGQGREPRRTSRVPCGDDIDT